MSIVSGSAGEPGQGKGNASFGTPRRQALRPGISSRTLQALSRVCSAISTAAVVVVLALVLTGVLANPRSSAPSTAPSAIPALVVVMVLVVATFVSYYVFLLRAKKEESAGYTLSRKGSVAVDQVDPKTGFVVRAAGEPQLTRAQESAALDRARALDLR